MVTYLWIALGGALGTVARYWMTNAVAALTGPMFPWGTILINIIGSFIIGLVAHMTTPVGRVPIPFDMRAFILVGICGGYTTFSAFSLQTLSLLHVSSAPRYVIYSYGQTLKPAQGSIVTSGGQFFEMITNYQVVSETATRAVVRVEGANTPQPHIVLESFNILPPE